jgi:hypothetical protein
MTKAKYTLTFLILLLIISGIFLFIKGQKDDLASNKYPNANVILIVIDALRADHLGCYGYPREISPETDKLAKEGIIFKNMLAQSSWTKPATASILTGLYPKSHGASGGNRIPEQVNLLPEILGKYGYRSYAFTANSFTSKAYGFDQGFGKFYFFQENVKKYESNIHIRSDQLSHFISKFILQLEDTNKNFIYIHYMDPHYPYTPKDKFFSRSNKREFTTSFPLQKSVLSLPGEEGHSIIQEAINAYDDEILFNDKMIGRLMQTLKNKNMYSNSIIIITSDHGEEFFEHGNCEHGNSLYDEVLKVPLIIRLPDKIHKTIVEIANQVDILPTILSLLKKPIPKDIEGINLLDNKRNFNLLSYAELSVSKITLISIRTLKHKLIEGYAGHLSNEPNYRWFEEKATIKTGDDSLELIIDSFYKNRMIQVSSNGEQITKFEITTGKQVFNIPLPGSNRKRDITIKSLTPCQVPKQLGINEDDRCLAFRIFNSRNVNVKDIRSGRDYKEYYSLSEDPGETNNLYNRRKYKKTIVNLRKKLKKYLMGRSTWLNKKRPAKLNQEQIKALKTLGYINENGDLK